LPDGFLFKKDPGDSEKSRVSVGDPALSDSNVDLSAKAVLESITDRLGGLIACDNIAILLLAAQFKL